MADFTAQLAYDAMKSWTMGGPIDTYMKDDLFARWYYKYLTFRTVSLYNISAIKNNKETSYLVPWPTGFGVMTQYLMNNDEAFTIMTAFLMGERAGFLQKFQELGVSMVANRLPVNPPTIVVPEIR